MRRACRRTHPTAGSRSPARAVPARLSCSALARSGQYAAGVGGVTVRLVGPMAVLRPGAADDRVVLGSRKARRLLALLAVRRGHLVATSQIVDVLWSTQPPRRPVREVATLVSRLRALLGPEVLLGGRDGYGLGSPPAVTVDLDVDAWLLAECKQLIDSAPARAALR